MTPHVDSLPSWLCDHIVGACDPNTSPQPWVLGILLHFVPAGERIFGARINCYEDGDSMDWHRDSGTIEFTTTLVAQLSSPDAYDGGVLAARFSDGGELRAIRDQGAVLIMDSDVEHSLSPIERGKRWALIVWTITQ